jgi:hypothetical protein
MLIINLKIIYICNYYLLYFFSVLILINHHSILLPLRILKNNNGLDKLVFYWHYVGKNMVKLNQKN